MMSETSSFESLDIQAEEKPETPGPLSMNYTESFSETPGHRMYLRIICVGCLAIALVIFGVFSIYWGALWKGPAHALVGWVIDLDGGPIGASVTSTFIASGQRISPVTWEIRHDVDGHDEVGRLIMEEHTWVAVVGMNS